MDRRSVRFTIRQLLEATAWFAVGAATWAIALRPQDLPDEHLFPWPLVLLTGITCVYLAVGGPIMAIGTLLNRRLVALRWSFVASLFALFLLLLLG